jgi:hypothetical protein
MLSVKLVTGIAALIGALICCMIANFSIWAMVPEVNQRLAQTQRIEYVFWHFGRLQHLFRAYSQLYPTGKLATRAKILGFAMMILFAMAAWGIGIF